MLYRNQMFKYQNEFVEHMKAGAESMGCVQVGLGKTVSTLTALSDMMAEDLATKGLRRRALVLGPKRVARDVWPDEVRLWDHLQHLRIDTTVGLKTMPGRVQRWMDPNLDIVTTNYEMLEKFLDSFPEGHIPFYFLVMDEVDKMKSHTTARYKALIKRAHEFQVRIGMTGTPTPESLMNIFCPVTLLTSQVTYPYKGIARNKPVYEGILGRNITQFRKQYFDKGHSKWSYEPRHGALEAITDTIAPITFTARAADHLDLPEVVVQDIHYELPAKAREQYVELEKKFILALERGDDIGSDSTAEDWDDEKVVEVDTAAILKNKLRQICSGFVYWFREPTPEEHRQFVLRDKDPQPIREMEWLHDAKVTAFKDLQSELMGEQLLAVYGYKPEYQKLDFDGRFGGDVTDGDERRFKREWDAGTLRTLGLHPASAGHGLNLQKSGACHIAFLTLPWSRGLYDQVIGRLHRMGQERTVIVHRFVAKGTVEEAVIDALDGKGALQRLVMKNLKERGRAA